jgi:hypothetical protein
MQRNKYLDDLGIDIKDYGSNYIYKKQVGLSRKRRFKRQR